ncbi:MAG TPA: sugar phosphate nucleotidyltransferase [Methylomirabilota bacterium]
MILAGGEGRRLRALTRAIAGETVPKQFCAVVGAETLLERTRRRAASSVAPARTVMVLTRAHERFYRPLLAGTPSHCAIVQPQDRGTAAAILYGLHRIAIHAPLAPVAVLPADHYVSDDAVFMRHVDAAFAAVTARPELVVLLGITPSGPDPDYGWIEPAELLPGTPLQRIARFWEKPGPAVARVLFERRCLWNSFVMVGRIPAFLALVRRSAPELEAQFSSLRPHLGRLTEPAAVRALYARLDTVSFSEQVLQSRSAALAVLPVKGVEWSDWGTPARVLATLTGFGALPSWAAGLRSVAV